MQQHPRTEACIQDLFSGSVFLVISTAVLSQAVNGELLLRSVEPFCASWIVWEEEPEEEGGEQGNDSFDDKEPAEAFESSSPVDVADAVCDSATECAGEVAEGDYECDANCALVPAVPDRYEVYDS